ncbi:unnamed protein product [Ranitomeya imitator]|uniref:Chromo domain-containing protein n=1 Tax=Ranitomeya imitator TaxID=111125 RepID=A0ABN9MIK7_9NEOB|nr:unnamed protein product [Ranitomeya imitator]
MTEPNRNEERSLLRKCVVPVVPSIDPPAPVLIDGELEYVVEKILDSRFSRRKLQYLVKWKGYGQEDNSWVVASDDDLVRAFHLAHPDWPGGSGRKCPIFGYKFCFNTRTSFGLVPRDSIKSPSLVCFLAGIKTGKCNKTQRTCEIYGWCPVENPGHLRSNTENKSDTTYLRTCTYDPISSPYCPIFKIREMVTKAGHSFKELSFLGGVVGIDIMWICDLDKSESVCKPQYSFRLQDRKNNFRTATYYWDRENQEYRDLLKLYGIRFEISVTGEARKFSIIPTVIRLGTGCAFLGAVSNYIDYITLHAFKEPEKCIYSTNFYNLHLLYNHVQ